MAGRAAFLGGNVPVRTGMTKVGMPNAPQGWQKTDVTIATVMKSLRAMPPDSLDKTTQEQLHDHLSAMHGFDEFLGNLYHSRMRRKNRKMKTIPMIWCWPMERNSKRFSGPGCYP